MIPTESSETRAALRQGRLLTASAAAMSQGKPKFYLIDHSLTNMGGHHFDSARLLLRAAVDLGFEPVLATNRRLRDRDGLPADWTILPLFRNTTYSNFSATAGSALSPSDPLGPPQTDDNGSWWSKLAGKWSRWNQRLQALSFASACREVFRRIPAAPGDQVFIPTLSEFDLVGLSEFLRTSETATLCEWHLQFHYQFLKGPVTSYGEQSLRRAAMRAHFAGVAARAGKVRWHFYSPTSALVDQYASLGIVPFRLLEHPVESTIDSLDAMKPSRQADDNSPLRVLCAGGLRADKGSKLLKELLADLERDDFAQGKIQLWIQAKRPGKLKRFAGKHNFVTLGQTDNYPPGNARLVHIPHPLPTNAYARLLRRVDAGLLAYDPNIYAVRCSGVLVEMLAAGTPVVVPGNTWLADELRSAGTPSPGLIATGPAGFAASLREMARLRGEFQRRAQAGAPSYAVRHSPGRVIEKLMSNTNAKAAA
ncbi:MAG: glycosyltransferase [Planctomycetales bacterium]|nr:glycosyltransferase [Planctomycetales bacterium]